ncbi:MAG: hypothetical protein WC080_03395 [Patescibacteria group bacterium]|jgi:PAS domain-containing protein
MPEDLVESQGKTLFGIKSQDILKLVETNYALIVIEGFFGLFFVYYFHAIPLWLALQAIIVTLVTNVALNLFIVFKASRLAQEIVLLIMGTSIILSLAIFVHYYPVGRSSFLLAFLPSVIFAASQSLSFGITTLLTVLASISAMFAIEYSGIRFLAEPYDIRGESVAWKVGTIFSLLFIILVGLMTIYFNNMIRKSRDKIAKLAMENKKLYQQSKTTSDEILKNMREGLIVLDNHLRIVQINEALSEMLKNKKDLTNFPVRELPIFFAPKLVIYLEDFKSNNTKRFSFKAQDELKNIYDISIARIELRKNEPGFIVMINQTPLPWGIVYESETKKPVDLALVRLHDASDERIIETRATDKDGRFGFIVTEGEYKITVTKEGYSFPSKAENGYIGEKIKVESAADSFLNIKIPLDKAKETKSEAN